MTDDAVGRPVAESWALIVGWLDEHVDAADEAIRPAASGAQLSALRAGLGRRIPSDVVAWLNLSNGVRGSNDFGYLLPTMFTPLSSEEMVAAITRLRSIFDGRSKPGDARPAGTRSVEWLDAFLPLAATSGGEYLFADLREGDRYGCVSSFEYEDGSGEPLWSGVSEMLADVANALTTESPVLQSSTSSAAPLYSSTPSAEDGALEWL